MRVMGGRVGGRLSYRVAVGGMKERSQGEESEDRDAGAAICQASGSHSELNIVTLSE